MGLQDRRAKLLRKLESRITKGKDPEGWLEELKGNLDQSIARNGVDSEQSRKWRILVCDQLEGLGRYGEASLRWEAQIQSLGRAKGSDDIETANAEGRLAVDLGFLSEYAKARVILQHAHEVFNAQRGPDDKNTVWAKRQIEMIDEEFKSDD